MLSFSRSMQKEKGHHPNLIFFEKTGVSGSMRFNECLNTQYPIRMILVF
jgi:hypothetical protein